MRGNACSTSHSPPSPSASGVRLCRTRTCYPLPRGERKGPQRPSSAAFSFCQPGLSRFVILGQRAEGPFRNPAESDEDRGFTEWILGSSPRMTTAGACPLISPLAGEMPRQGQRGVTPRTRKYRLPPPCHFVTSPPQGGRLNQAPPIARPPLDAGFYGPAISLPIHPDRPGRVERLEWNRIWRPKRPVSAFDAPRTW